jgi:polyhydroxyalkanoate synthase
MNNRKSSTALKTKPGNDFANNDFAGGLERIFKLDQESITRLDSEFRARLAKATSGLSPALYATAITDWLSHLVISPARQLSLAKSGIRRGIGIGELVLKSLAGKKNTTLLKAPKGDSRFSAEEWQKPPFNIAAQTFLTMREWAMEAAGGIPGQDPDHEAFVKFVIGQTVDILAPSNIPLINPTVLKTTVKERGANLGRGAKFLLSDGINKLLGRPASIPDLEKFRVGETLAITPGKVIFRNELIELIQYTATTKKVKTEPLLIVPPWIMKYYILDLSPENSLVKYLVDRGQTVFMISWINPGSELRDYGIEEYVEHGILAAMDAVQTVVKKSKINLVGYCAGGSLAIIAAAWLARQKDQRLNSLTTFTAQSDFSEPGDIKVFLNESELAFMQDMMAKDGYLDKSYFAKSFSALNANALTWGPMIQRYYLGQETTLFDIMAWNTDLTRVPAKLHYECMKSMFVRNEIAEDKFRLFGDKVHLSQLKIPLFFVATTTDHVAPWASVYKIHRLAPYADLCFCLTSGGHNAGIVSGAENPRRSYRLSQRQAGDPFRHPDDFLSEEVEIIGSWWPAWSNWLSSQCSGERVAPKPGGSGKDKLHILGDAPGEYVFVQ